MTETDISEDYIKSIEEKQFKSKYKWLGENFVVQKYKANIESSTSKRCGRPCLPYQEKSTRSQRRKAFELTKEIMEEDLDLVMHATTIAARKRGSRDLAIVINETMKTPNRPSKIRKLIFSSSDKKEPIPFSEDEAPALLFDNNFSKRQYVNIRLESKNRNCDIYPKYDALIIAKKNCRRCGITVTETTARVPLQNLLEHTIKRIILLQMEVIDNVILKSDNDIIETEMIFSYGFDGSSGHSIYKQRFENSANLAESDSSLFANTLIPLRFLTCNSTILWNNNTPYSVRFCRPLKLQYIKETKELILKEKEDIDNEIKNLSCLNFLYKDKILKIKFNLIMTLVDGKVLHTLTSLKGRLQNQKLRKLKLPPVVLALLCPPSIEPEPTTSTSIAEIEITNHDVGDYDNEDTLHMLRHLQDIELNTEDF